MAVTYVSQKTCPSTCPLRNNGCYAEVGMMRMAITSKINNTEEDIDSIIDSECSAIDKLPANKTLRIHGVGDAPTPQAAKKLAIAGKNYLKRAKNKSAKVYSYTHAWRTVKRKYWGVVSTLASCETTKQVKEARKQGYAASIVVAKFDSDKLYVKDGEKLLPCPSQTKGITCSQCKLCTNDTHLRKAKISIAFEAHGVRKEKVKKMLELPLI